MSERKDVDPAHLSAWQRWELGSLDEPAPAAPPEAERVPLPTAEEVERIVAQAHQEGYGAGYQEGMRAAQADVARLRQVAAALEAAADGFAARVEGDLAQLVLALTRQMVRDALAHQPDLVLSLVREAAGSLPVFTEAPRILLHPDDAALVRAHLGDDIAARGWRVLEAPDLARGGCRVETAHNEIDASLEARWQQLLAAFAAGGGWER